MDNINKDQITVNNIKKKKIDNIKQGKDKNKQVLYSNSKMLNA